jgi:hypothetical protein
MLRPVETPECYPEYSFQLMGAMLRPMLRPPKTQNAAPGNVLEHVEAMWSYVEAYVEAP